MKNVGDVLQLRFQDILQIWSVKNYISDQQIIGEVDALLGLIYVLFADDEVIFMHFLVRVVDPSREINRQLTHASLSDTVNPYFFLSLMHYWSYSG